MYISVSCYCLHIDKAQLRTTIANGTKVIGPNKNKLINEIGKGLPQVTVTLVTNHAGFETSFRAVKQLRRPCF